MSDRFPDVDWRCDRCDAHLNNQPGFDDHKYSGFALNVGYKNSISATNIYESEEDYLLNPGDNPLPDDDGYSYDVVGVDKRVC